jgi:hypothetical protein
MIPRIHEVLEYNDVYIIICDYEKVIEIAHECHYRGIFYSSYQRGDGKWQMKIGKRDLLSWIKEKIGFSSPLSHFINKSYNMEQYIKSREQND